MGGNATLVPACGACICCTAIFLSIFFAVNLPEIRRNTVYQYTECTVTDVRTIPFRACSVACSCSDCVGCPSCSGKWAVHESRDKYNLDDEDVRVAARFGGSCVCGGRGTAVWRQCVRHAHALTVRGPIVPRQIEGECNDGYTCCRRYVCMHV